MSKDSQQSLDLEDLTKLAGADVDVDREHDPTVARRASNAGLNREASAVQKKGADGVASDQVHAAAARGTSASAGQLPFHDQIQASFGDHDISHVKSHIDGESTSAMGADAYASGNDVVFGKQPDLHTAAHEVAHVVQQTGGVNLKGGVGQAGDAYEQNADAVADRVVAGKSAGDLLGPVKSAEPAPSQAVQRKGAPTPAEAHAKSDSNSYDAAQAALNLLAKQMHEARPKLEGWMKEKTPKEMTEAGYGPEVTHITELYESIKRGAEHAGSLLGVVNKADAHTMAPDVRLVLGGYTRFQPYMQKASDWMASHQGSRVDVPAIHTIIDGYRDRIGLDSTATLTPDATAPTASEGKLTDTMVASQFAAVRAAMDSVKAGAGKENKEDASRITVELRVLASLVRDDHASMKTHKPEIKALSKELEEIRNLSPDLKERLAEAHNALLTISA